MDFLTPEFFDALVIANIAIGLAIAVRRFLRDIGGPLPDDAPQWARARSRSPYPNSSSSQDS